MKEDETPPTWEELKRLAVPRRVSKGRPRRTPHPRCTGKKRCYESEAVIRRKHVSAGFRVRTYWCDDCRAYHAANGDKK